MPKIQAVKVVSLAMNHPVVHGIKGASNGTCQKFTDETMAPQVLKGHFLLQGDS